MPATTAAHDRPVDLLLLRHPRVNVAPGLCYGQLDLPAAQPLHPSWQSVATQLQTSLHEAGSAPIGQVISSPLQRALALAQPLATHWGVRLQTDARWQELHFGQWEGQPWSALNRAQTEAWTANVHTQAPPGGESRAALLARVQAALDDARRSGAGSVLIVSHAGPLRCALGVALGLPAEQVPDVALGFGRLSWLRWHGGAWPRWSVQAINR